MRWNPFICLLLLILQSGAASAQKNNDVMGSWASNGSIFRVYEENGRLHGRVEAVKDAVYLSEEDPARAGQIRLDDMNPDDVLKKRPLVGIEMFSEYRIKDGQWQGLIYDPESGKTYQSKMKVATDGRLEIRGYIGIPMFGRTSKFQPVKACSEEIQQLLAMMNNSQTCS
ncbi:MAG: hypothetical protein ACI9FB_001838 [Candidatus Azotimanducaceae bacterium]|jgi:uncharacterized protein (DUF2147 family)